MRLRLALCLLAAIAAARAETIVRATAGVNGVTSPRGFFNITVRLYQIPGVEWAKFDLKRSSMTLDFQPGVTVRPETIQAAMVEGGYKPGAVRLEQVERPSRYDRRLGWTRIKRPTSKNAVGRWFQLNF